RVVATEAVKDAVNEQERKLLGGRVLRRARLLLGHLRADNHIADDERTRHRVVDVVHREGEHVGRRALTQCFFLELCHPRRLDERHSQRRALWDGQQLECARCDAPERRHVDKDMLLVIEGDSEAISSGILFVTGFAHRLSSKRRYASTISWTILWRTTS